MAKEFPLKPVQVKTISTRYRKISGLIPNNETISRINTLREHEPLSMRGQAPIIWERAEGINVYDAYGNMWLDFSSGVLVTNAGHGCSQIVDAIVKEASKPLLTTYCFANNARIKLVTKLAKLAPEGLNKVFLLSTGSETTECALKLMRTHGRKIQNNKSVIISFLNSFHGRTLGAQQIGALPGSKTWIKNLDPEIVHVPFPDGFLCEDNSFGLFEKTLAKHKVRPENTAGVISETYQGIGPHFMPKEYAKKLREWCNSYNAILCFDEVQAAFGRCGTLWGFQLYDVVPDLFCLGKGLSSSLPISAVVGKPKVMDLYGPNEMTSTHSGNPICCAAALANIEVIESQKLIDNAASVGIILQEKLQQIKGKFPGFVALAPGKGLVAGLLMVKKDTKNPDQELAWNIVKSCFRKGLLLFAPVGVKEDYIKIAPPLCITKEAIEEGCSVIFEAIKESIQPSENSK